MLNEKGETHLIQVNSEASEGNPSLFTSILANGLGGQCKGHHQLLCCEQAVCSSDREEREVWANEHLGVLVWVKPSLAVECDQARRGRKNWVNERNWEDIRG